VLLARGIAGVLALAVLWPAGAGIAWALTLAAVSVALLYAGCTLAGFALKGELPKLLRLRRLLASFAAIVVAIAAYWVVLAALY
jgi:hypothetical protein